MANKNLTQAKQAKNDEFYTQFADIEKEVLAYLDYDPNVFKGKTILLPCDDPEWSNFTKFFAMNFKRFGLKKLISTSYAPDSNPAKVNYKPGKIEQLSLKFDEQKSRANGRVFVLTRDITRDGKIDFDDLEWEYLNGDGDFRSSEVTKLRDEADIIITNPPFSLFRAFLAWIVDGDKRFLVIGNLNAITYKEVFPQIKANKLWLGATGNGTDMVFEVPDGAKVQESDKQKAERLGYIGNYTRLGNSCWFTNIEHGRRHTPLALMTEKDVVRYGLERPFEKYDNYDAIDVPKTKWIPSDYTGVMGVPITFLDKYCPEQFEILGCNRGVEQDSEKVYGRGSFLHKKETFKRLFIRHRKSI